MNRNRWTVLLASLVICGAGLSRPRLAVAEPEDDCPGQTDGGGPNYYDQDGDHIWDCDISGDEYICVEPTDRWDDCDSYIDSAKFPEGTETLEASCDPSNPDIPVYCKFETWND